MRGLQSKTHLHQEKPLKLKQYGFSLIELIVVVLIISILLSVAVISLKPSESNLINESLLNAKALMISACDQAAFDQKIHLVLPSKTSLKIYQRKNKQWTLSQTLKPIAWHEALQVRWQVDNGMKLPNNPHRSLSDKGWLCWPDGELTPGKLFISYGKESHSLSWNEVGEFKLESTTEHK